MYLFEVDEQSADPANDIVQHPDGQEEGGVEWDLALLRVLHQIVEKEAGHQAPEKDSGLVFSPTLEDIFAEGNWFL
jgi:hypothetical protein